VVQTLSAPLFLGRDTALVGISTMWSTSSQNYQALLPFATWNVRTLMDSDTSDRPARREVHLTRAVRGAEC